MMGNLKTNVIGLSLILWASYPSCYADSLPDQGVLDNFIATQHAANPQPPISKPTVTDEGDIELLSYQMQSQSWPLNPNLNICPAPPEGQPLYCTNIWTNSIDIYIPKGGVAGTQALLYLGANEPTGDGNKLDLKTIAEQTKMVVVGVGNIPYQGDENNHEGGIAFPPIDPQKPNFLYEDFLIAHTWRLFLNDPSPISPQNPNGYQFMPNHLPMVFAAIQAMDFIQGKFFVKPESPYPLNIQSFVVSGVSKRGWATWLTAIEDTRVAAIVPVVIDFLNTKANILRMKGIFHNYYPYAYYPYYHENIDPSDANFDQLMSIQDPLSYQKTKPNRFLIPKYMVNSSGDDIFLPDNSQNYIDILNSNNSTNYLRYIPNTGHEFDPDKLSTYSLIPFLNRLNTQQVLPNLTWKINSNSSKNNQHTLVVNYTNQAPANTVKSIIAWHAVNGTANPYRDFRNKCGVRYVENDLEITPNNSASYTINDVENEWSATYIEVTYSDNFVITTPVFVYPDTTPTALPSPVDPSNECSFFAPLEKLGKKKINPNYNLKK